MTDTMAGLTDIFENPFDFDDPRIEVARVLTRTEAKAVLEFSGDIVQILAAQPSAGAQGEAVAVADLEVAELEYRKVMESVSGIPLARYAALQRAILAVSALWSRKPIATPAQPDTGAVAALREGDIRWLLDHLEGIRDIGPTREGRIGRIKRALAALSTANTQGGVVEPCGGCGEADPSARCIGCLHDFAGNGASK